jgi:hypothetical protein
MISMTFSILLFGQKTVQIQDNKNSTISENDFYEMEQKSCYFLLSM